MEGWQGAAQTPTVIPYLISNQVTCGQTRIMFSLLDKDNRPVAAPDRPLSIAFYDLGKDPSTPVTKVDGTFIWAIEGQRGVYAADVDLPEAGTWGLEFTTSAPGGPAETIRATMDVLESSSVVKVGEPCPIDQEPDPRRRRGRRVEDLDGPEARSGLLPDIDRRRARGAQAVHPGVRHPEVLHQPAMRADARSHQAGRGGQPVRDVHQRRALPAPRRRRPAPADPRRQRPAPVDGRDERVGAVHRAVDLRGRRRRRRPRLVRAHRERPGDPGRDQRRSRSRASWPARPGGTRLRASTGRRDTRPGRGWRSPGAPPDARARTGRRSRAA